MSRRHHSKARRGKTTRGPIVFFTMVVVLSATILVLTARRPSGRNFIITPESHPKTSQSVCSPSEVVTMKMIPVHIDGAIENPGVYYVSENTLLFDLVTKAGGFAEDADKSSFNLAMRLEAHMKIYVPRIGEVMNQEPVQGQNQEERADRKIDLNDATKELLESLPGIGPATADAIITYRESNGPFKAIEDLMLVPGIKEGRFARLKDKLVVLSP